MTRPFSPTDIVVTRWGARFMGRRFPCSIGKGGITDTKREGDGASPRASLTLPALYYRADRIFPLQGNKIGPHDLWRKRLRHLRPPLAQTASSDRRMRRVPSRSPALDRGTGHAENTADHPLKRGLHPVGYVSDLRRALSQRGFRPDQAGSKRKPHRNPVPESDPKARPDSARLSHNPARQRSRSRPAHVSRLAQSRSRNPPTCP